jgi:hypothetical protein
MRIDGLGDYLRGYGVSKGVLKIWERLRLLQTRSWKRELSVALEWN